MPERRTPGVSDLDRAATTIADGELIVYPTETVYGLGADALAPAAVEAVFAAKKRDRSEPVSMAVPTVAAAAEHTEPTDSERAFMQEFLPGPVTVVLEAGPAVPETLTASRDRVGIRVPDHERALAVLERTGPITATSANVSGRESARTVEDLDDRIRRAATVVIDGGETPGGGSTVVDIERGEIHRRGADAEQIEAWLAAR